MRWKGTQLGLLFADKGTLDKPAVETHVFSDCAVTPQFLNELEQEIIWRFNLDLDLPAFYDAMAGEMIVEKAIQRFRGLRPMHAGSLYEYLIIAIVLQNATVRRSASMLQSLFECFGTSVEFDQKEFWCFWEPSALAEADELELRALKMGYRATSLRRVSRPFSDDQISEVGLRQATWQEQEQALMSLYGIGPASVGYIVVDVFHRWDYLKYISPWEQKIYTNLFFGQDYEAGVVPVGEMLRYFDRWREWKCLAIHYVWEDLWWMRRNTSVPWLEKLIRL